jgi:alpha-1,3/alpha-1,6-mannosyltransferase
LPLDATSNGTVETVIERDMEQPHIEQSLTSLRVVFVHLDWGIGGAEQLMLQLCQATQQIENDPSTHQRIDIHLVTSYCSPDHCFALLHPNTGSLHQYLNVWGSWIPSHVIADKGKAIMSTIRLLYLAIRIVHHPILSKADVIVLDVLPTPLWIFRYFCPLASLLFYCHFPDQLLIRHMRNDHHSFLDVLFAFYRKLLNVIEERSMILADTVVVNSKFTQRTVRQTFPSLQDHPLPVLYPALEITPSLDDSSHEQTFVKQPNLVVSLNRFERKKNLDLLVEAMAWIQQQHPKLSTTSSVHLVIAGGYDKLNVENVEYRIELQQLANKLNVQVDFRQSISDAERTQLLHTATMVVYTPANEHFGIVPLEAMYAGTTVIACNSGGPVETIVHGETGFLCEPTPEAFGTSIAELLHHPDRARRMGQVGRDHVLQNFSPQHLQREWQHLVYQTIERSEERRLRFRNVYRVVSPRTLLYIFECLAVFMLSVFLTRLLQYMTILQPQQSLLSAFRRIFQRDEL